MTAIDFRAKFSRTNAIQRNILLFNENLADVVIEVYPSSKSSESGSQPQSKKQRIEPAAQLPAHMAILAGKNERKIISQRPKKVISIKGYSVEAVKYLIAHLYDDTEACAAQKRQSLQEWEELLRLADEYESFSSFDTVSCQLMDTFLSDPNGTWHDYLHPLLEIDLADVVIEVYPSATGFGAGPDPHSEQQSTEPAEPAAKLPAHAAILAAKNEYFRALFSNGMAETLGPQAWTIVDTNDGQNLLAQRQKRNIKIKGYPVEAVKYFIAYLYDDSEACVERQRLTLQDFDDLLKMANQYGSFSFFDTVSFRMMNQYLNVTGGTSMDNFFILLNIGGYFCYLELTNH
ncbi:hypothetical protein DFS34DRAFT_690554 [Phlyctochytrium arcticum]|nr:hypothetical protein DFS34DRAFT_690554 [Phlyctochytrium arcticum]